MKDNTKDGYASKRCTLFDLLAKDSKSFGKGLFWALRPSVLKYCRSEGAAGFKVPYHLGADDEAIIEGAVRSLALLIKKRFEGPAGLAGPGGPAGPAGKAGTSGVGGVGGVAGVGGAQVSGGAGQGLDPLAPSASYDGEIDLEFAHPLKEKSWKTDLLADGTIEKLAAIAALRSAPVVDGAVLSNWLGPDGYGRWFVHWFAILMDKALVREGTLGGSERTSFVALLAVIASVARHKALIKEIRVRGVSYEKLDLAVGLSLHAALGASLEGLLARLKAGNAAYHNVTTGLILSSALTPGPFISVHGGLLSTSHNPYNLAREAVDAFVSLGVSLDDKTPGGAGAFTGKIKQALKKNKVAIEAVSTKLKAATLRGLALEYLLEFDMPGYGVHPMLWEICEEERFADKLLTDEKGRGELAKGLAIIKKNYSREVKRVEAIGAIEGFLASLGSSKRTWFGGGASGAPPEEAIEAFVALCFDSFVESSAAEARGRLTDSRGSLDEGLLIQEYSLGRLYRFSTDNREILTSLEAEEEGHLFFDMKDFTRRAAELKDLDRGRGLGEFLSRNLYAPLIEAASRYAPAPGSTGSGQAGVRLSSLQGEAAVFSGDVASLISLAGDIQKLSSLFGVELKRRSVPVEGALAVGEINKKYMGFREELRKKRAEVEKTLKGKEAEVKLEALTLAVQRNESAYRAELEAAIITGELETGVFVSYGTKAETLLTEGKPGFSTPVTVTVGGNISEAERGTFRNTSVKADLEMMLERDRGRRKTPALAYPFNVYVGKTYGLRLPPELDKVIEKLVTCKGRVDSKPFATLVANLWHEDMLRLSEGRSFSELKALTSTVDIYNRGTALSEQALMAYMRGASSTRFFFEKRVKTSALSKAVTGPFFFPIDEIVLWFGASFGGGGGGGEGSLDGFVMAGEVALRGKDPTVVYEMLDPDGPFLTALKKHHIKDWLKEARANKKKAGK